MKILPQWGTTRSCLLLCWIALHEAFGRIDSDGLCTVHTFVPFTIGGFSTWSYSFQNITIGTSHMAAALMAIDHFNTRNSTIVPQVAEIEECNIMFDVNHNMVFDTGTIGHKASRSLVAQDGNPCGIAGPFNDVPALELSAFALAHEYPLVAHRSSNIRIASEEDSPFSSQTYPDIIQWATMVLEFLFDKGRTDYIGLVYALTDTGTHRHEALGVNMDARGIDWLSASYFPVDDSDEFEEDKDEIDARTPLGALGRIKERGYRTIVVAMEFPWNELPALANAAEQLGMNEGDHMWVFYGNFEPFFVFEDEPNITKIVSGSAWVLPVTGTEVDPENDPFSRVWRSQGKDLVDRCNEANPIEPGEPGYIFFKDTFFQDYHPEYGSSFMYDAVMSLGLGACGAEKDGTDVIQGQAHFDGIHSVEFDGATGTVRYGDDEKDKSGSRAWSTVTFGALNLRPPGLEYVTIELTDRFDPGSTEWTQVKPFVYRDGRTVPPDLLRRTPEQNYLSSGLRIVGFTLMGIALLSAMATALWVYIHRKHRVLRAAQPHFLYLLALGAGVGASGIFGISFDESYGWSEEQLSSACMSTVWLVSLGYTITYSALFTKLWRVNKVLQFSRRKISLRQVAWPMAALVVSALILLSLWNALDPLRWNRVVTNDITGESIGECDSDYIGAFIAPLAIILIIPAVLTAFFAWKTKDVDDSYAESWWIFALIVVQVEVVFVSAPVVAILREVSSDGRYVGLSFMLWILPMSTLSLIMLPKVMAYHKAQRGGNEPQRRKRGAQSATGVYVSGLSNDMRTTTASVTLDDPKPDNNIAENSPEAAHMMPVAEGENNESAERQGNGLAAQDKDVPVASEEGDVSSEAKNEE